jgi:competence protein ComEC
VPSDALFLSFFFWFDMKKILPLLIGSCVMVVLVVAVARRAPSRCHVTALDVGQGDAIYIRTPDGQDILIDGGPDDRVVDRLSQHLPAGDRDIELMVLTHPHADHVNGLVAVTERYEVRQVLETGLPYEQTAYTTWHAMIRDRHIPVQVATAGVSIAVGAAHLTVLWPALDLHQKNIVGDNAAEGGGINDSSVVLKLACGGSAAMLMGDASSEIEDRLLDGGVDVRADLLKVGHHGSRFSSSRRFLETVQPVWTVVSVGVGNSYHHPHPTTLLHLVQLGSHVLRTDELGDVEMVSDGRGGWERGP